jgi:hypothetical protein
LRNLIIQHIGAGHGVGLIDPHGDLAEEILNHIPPHRADHVVYFNPGDVEFPVGFNVLGDVSPDDRHLVASGVVSAFKGIWRDSWGPRTEYLLYNAVSALLDCRNATLLGVSRLLVDDAFRAKVVRQIKDPFIRAFWEDEYANYDERFKREAIAPIQNKLGQFLLNPVIRNIVGQVKAKMNIPFMMNHARIFIANLSKGQLGAEKANLIGSLLTAEFQLAAMAILMHNHPSGDPTPSQADFQVTRELVRAGKIVRIDVLDHVIIGATGQVSLNDLGHCNQ